MRHRAGFTLIELLVVIAIISILASILFPVFSRAREKGRQTTCMSNLRQLGMAAVIYSLDNDGRYPGPADILGTGGIYVCPSDPNAAANGFSYEINKLLAGFSESGVDDPSGTVLMLDAGVDDGYFDPGTAIPETPVPMLSQDYPASSIPNPMNAIHFDRANVVYTDGHAGSLPYGRLTVEMLMP